MKHHIIPKLVSVGFGSTQICWKLLYDVVKDAVQLKFCKMNNVM